MPALFNRIGNNSARIEQQLALENNPDVRGSAFPAGTRLNPQKHRFISAQAPVNPDTMKNFSWKLLNQEEDHSMTRRIVTAIVLVLAAGLLLTAPVIPQQKPPEVDSARQAVQKAVLETNARMNQASGSLNADAFFEFILDAGSGTIIQDGTLFKSRQEALEAVRQGFRGIAKMDRQFIDPQVTVISPDTALLTSQGSTTATLEDGRVLQSRFAVSLLFVRREGQWKLLHGHYSLPNQNR
jgi:uncharacterized protein (TIGR02246 family)